MSQSSYEMSEGGLIALVVIFGIFIIVMICLCPSERTLEKRRIKKEVNKRLSLVLIITFGYITRTFLVSADSKCLRFYIRPFWYYTLSSMLVLNCLKLG